MDRDVYREIISKIQVSNRVQFCQDVGKILVFSLRKAGEPAHEKGYGLCH